MLSPDQTKPAPKRRENALTLKRPMIAVNTWSGRVMYPDSLKPKEYQIRAAEFSLSQTSSYLDVAPGLGKTIIAALIANTMPHLDPVYICPPFLVENTYCEFLKWAPTRFKSMIVIPDNRLEYFKYECDGKKVLLIVDEAHRFKNETAKRTKALFNKVHPISLHTVFMSGTPMPNRPMELYAVLSKAAPETIRFMNKFQYGMRYCAGFRGHWGYDFTGASRLPELREQVKGKFMLSMKKKDVAQELPAKMEEMVILGGDLPKTIAEIDKSLLKQYSPTDLMKHALGDLHVATYRKELGKAKAKLAIDFIKDILDNSKDPVLVFAIHKEVVEKLYYELLTYKPLVITGDTPSSQRLDIVNQFQNSPEHKLMIGNIQAAGIGFTMTRAPRVIFVEFDWVPGSNEQASDRAHRIGQDKDVLVSYLVFKNSLDRTVLESILKKRGNIEQLRG